MRFQLVERDHKAGFCGLDHRVHDARRHDFADAHRNELADADLYAGSTRRDIQPDGHEAEEDHKENDRCDNDDDRNHKFLHGRILPEFRFVLVFGFSSLVLSP